MIHFVQDHCLKSSATREFEVFDVYDNKLKVSSASGLSGLFATENDCVCAGPLPKVLPTSLEVLDVSGGFRNPHKFTGGIPPEWGALTNLKELKMANCGLDGKPLSTRSERLHMLLTFMFCCYRTPAS